MCKVSLHITWAVKHRMQECEGQEEWPETVCE